MMDRESINLYNMQMGFVEFVVAPLILTVINILYPLYPIGHQMLENYIDWAQMRRNEIYTDANVTGMYVCVFVSYRVCFVSDLYLYLHACGGLLAECVQFAVWGCVLCVGDCVLCTNLLYDLL